RKPQREPVALLGRRVVTERFLHHADLANHDAEVWVTSADERLAAGERAPGHREGTTTLAAAAPARDSLVKPGDSARQQAIRPRRSPGSTIAAHRVDDAIEIMGSDDPMDQREPGRVSAFRAASAQSFQELERNVGRRTTSA